MSFSNLVTKAVQAGEGRVIGEQGVSFAGSDLTSVPSSQCGRRGVGGQWTEAMQIKHFHCCYPGSRGPLETPRKMLDFREIATCFGKAQNCLRSHLHFAKRLIG